MGDVRLISGALFDRIGDLAAGSPRLRMNHNFHSSPEESTQRFLNVLLRGTYIRPHRHLVPPKFECFMVLQGEADVVLFNDEGAIVERHRLGMESREGRMWGVDIAPGVWHTILARTDRVVCFEVKPGPWVPGDTQFAAWSPAEDDSRAAAYCNNLLNR